MYYHHLDYTTPALAQRFLEEAQLDANVITSHQIIDVCTVLLTSEGRLEAEEITNIFEEANRLQPPHVLDLEGWHFNKEDPEWRCPYASDRARRYRKSA